jgi:archaellum biogenesis protein FlaJ (TadC family)
MKNLLECEVAKTESGQSFIGGLIGLLISIVIVVAVVIPVTNDVITSLNATGTLGTILNIVPIMLAVLALVVVTAGMSLYYGG